MAVTQITSKARSNYQDLHLKLDFELKLATLDSRPLVLTRKEYQLFSLLVENAGMIAPRQVLLKRVWGYSNEIRTHTLEVHIYRLRKMLGSYSKQYIESIFRTGYRFQPITQERLDRPGRQLSALSGRLKIVRGEQSAGLARGVTARGGGQRGWSFSRRSQDATGFAGAAKKILQLVPEKR